MKKHRIHQQSIATDSRIHFFNALRIANKKTTFPAKR